jgi:anion-transporting  ArsA/GET3 family ATPase
MLRVPKVIVDIVPPGLLRCDAEHAWAMFRDKSRTAIVVVTLPEEMPTTETVELAASLEGELGLHVRHIVVNQVLPPLFSPSERLALADLGDIAVSSAGTAALRSARHRAVRERVQTESLARLAKELPGPPKTYLPLLFEDAASPSAIKGLSKRL